MFITRITRTASYNQELALFHFVKKQLTKVKIAENIFLRKNQVVKMRLFAWVKTEAEKRTENPKLSMSQNKSLWEILVPANSNEGLEYSIEHHRQWDEEVREISGGITILRAAKGQWLDPDRKLSLDKIIPVRVYCTEPQIDQIIQFTMAHYDQKAVMAYMVSSYVKLVHKKG